MCVRMMLLTQPHSAREAVSGRFVLKITKRHRFFTKVSYDISSYVYCLKNKLDLNMSFALYTMDNYYIGVI